jgi:hypothetical protein
MSLIPRFQQQEKVVQDAEKAPIGMLASLRGSTYRGVQLASSLAAALLDGLSEHPASYSGVNATRKNTAGFERKLSFSSAC